MAKCQVKLEKTTVHTAVVEIDLKGDSMDELDDALSDHMTDENEEKLLAQQGVEWELDSEQITEYEIDEYNYDNSKED